MYYIDTSRNGKPVYDPIINQSIDSYLIGEKQLKGHGLMLYINRPAVIIGRFQNAYAEVNLPYLEENDITLVRRTGGGGAVYHDFGNLIYENIVMGDTSHFGDYGYYAQPIVDALKEMGIENISMQGRNDISVEGQKFSGMSMVKIGSSMAAGGTLLYDLDSEQASKVLTPNQAKLSTKGVKSVDKRITNLKPYLPEALQDLDSEAFKQELLKHIFHVSDVKEIERYTLTEEDWARIDERVAETFGTKEWNYGKNPSFDYYLSTYTVGVGTIAYNWSVDKENKISNFQVYGDMGYAEPEKIQEALLGTPFEEEALKEAFEKANYQQTLGKINLDELVQALQNEVKTR